MAPAPRCFSLMAGAGFDAKVVAGVSAPLKRRLGRAAYVWRSLVEARRYRPVRYQVEIDGDCHEASSVIVTRSRHYAGPCVVAPEAALGAPLLGVCLFERWGRSHASVSALALLLGRLPRTAGYRVVTGRVGAGLGAERCRRVAGAARPDRRRQRAHLARVDRARRRSGTPAAAGLSSRGRPVELRRPLPRTARRSSPDGSISASVKASANRLPMPAKRTSSTATNSRSDGEAVSTAIAQA